MRYNGCLSQDTLRCPCSAGLAVATLPIHAIRGRVLEVTLGERPLSQHTRRTKGTGGHLPVGNTKTTNQKYDTESHHTEGWEVIFGGGWPHSQYTQFVVGCWRSRWESGHVANTRDGRRVLEVTLIVSVVLSSTRLSTTCERPSLTRPSFCLSAGTWLVPAQTRWRTNNSCRPRRGCLLASSWSSLTVRNCSA